MEAIQPMPAGGPLSGIARPPECRAVRAQRYKVLNLLRQLAELSARTEVVLFEARQLAACKAHPYTRVVHDLPEAERSFLAHERAKRMQDLLQKSGLTLVKAIIAHKFAHVFSFPVDTNAYPTYLQTVKQPMDLGTIKERLELGQHYKEIKDLWSDICLVFSNAKLFNPPGHDVHIMAQTVQEFFEERWEKTVQAKVQEEYNAATKEEAIARKRCADLLMKADAQALEQQALQLMAIIEELHQGIQEVKTQAAALCEGLDQAEVDMLADALKALPAKQLQAAVQLVTARLPALQPTTLRDGVPELPGVPARKLVLNLDQYDALTLRQLQLLVSKCKPATHHVSTGRGTQQPVQRQQAAPAAGAMEGQQQLVDHQGNAASKVSEPDADKGTAGTTKAPKAVADVGIAAEAVEGQPDVDMEPATAALSAPQAGAAEDAMVAEAADAAGVDTHTAATEAVPAAADAAGAGTTAPTEAATEAAPPAADVGAGQKPAAEHTEEAATVAADGPSEQPAASEPAQPPAPAAVGAVQDPVQPAPQAEPEVNLQPQSQTALAAHEPAAGPVITGPVAAAGMPAAPEPSAAADEAQQAAQEVHMEGVAATPAAAPVAPVSDPSVAETNSVEPTAAIHPTPMEVDTAPEAAVDAQAASAASTDAPAAAPDTAAASADAPAAAADTPAAPAMTSTAPTAPAPVAPAVPAAAARSVQTFGSVISVASGETSLSNGLHAHHGRPSAAGTANLPVSPFASADSQGAVTAAGPTQTAADLTRSLSAHGPAAANMPAEATGNGVLYPDVLGFRSIPDFLTTMQAPSAQAMVGISELMGAAWPAVPLGAGIRPRARASVRTGEEQMACERRDQARHQAALQQQAAARQRKSSLSRAPQPPSLAQRGRQLSVNAPDALTPVSGLYGGPVSANSTPPNGLPPYPPPPAGGPGYNGPTGNNSMTVKVGMKRKATATPAGGISATTSGDVSELVGGTAMQVDGGPAEGPDAQQQGASPDLLGPPQKLARRLSGQLHAGAATTPGLTGARPPLPQTTPISMASLTPSAVPASTDASKPGSSRPQPTPIHIPGGNATVHLQVHSAAEDGAPSGPAGAVNAMVAISPNADGAMATAMSQVLNLSSLAGGLNPQAQPGPPPPSDTTPAAGPAAAPPAAAVLPAAVRTTPPPIMLTPAAASLLAQAAAAQKPPPVPQLKQSGGQPLLSMPIPPNLPVGGPARPVLPLLKVPGGPSPVPNAANALMQLSHFQAIINALVQQQQQQQQQQAGQGQAANALQPQQQAQAGAGLRSSSSGGLLTIQPLTLLAGQGSTPLPASHPPVLTTRGSNSLQPTITTHAGGGGTEVAATQGTSSLTTQHSGPPIITGSTPILPSPAPSLGALGNLQLGGLPFSGLGSGAQLQQQVVNFLAQVQARSSQATSPTPVPAAQAQLPTSTPAIPVTTVNTPSPAVVVAAASTPSTQPSSAAPTAPAVAGPPSTTAGTSAANTASPAGATTAATPAATPAAATVAAPAAPSGPPDANSIIMLLQQLQKQGLNIPNNVMAETTRRMQEANATPAGRRSSSGPAEPAAPGGAKDATTKSTKK